MEYIATALLAASLPVVDYIGVTTVATTAPAMNAMTVVATTASVVEYIAPAPAVYAAQARDTE